MRKAHPKEWRSSFRAPNVVEKAQRLGEDLMNSCLTPGNGEVFVEKGRSDSAHLMRTVSMSTAETRRSHRFALFLRRFRIIFSVNGMLQRWFHNTHLSVVFVALLGLSHKEQK